MNHYSLRSRLIKWVSLPILLASLLTLLIGAVFAWKEIEEVYDAQMAHSAKLLLQVIEYGEKDPSRTQQYIGEESDLYRQRYENKLTFRIWQNDTLLARSWNSDQFSDIEAPSGFSNREVAGKPWRFFVFFDPANHIKIEIAQRYAIRYEILGQLVISLAAPVLVFMPLIFLIVWIGVRKSLKPVVKISADVDRRNSDDLSSISPDTLPREILPLIMALNRLFRRIEDSFKREREFTDHAAHELRTPLAAMKTQAQVIEKRTKEIPECAEGFENLLMSIDRATHLVEQLLSLARLQNENVPMVRMNLSECLRDAIEMILPQATAKQITLTHEIAAPCYIMGHSDSLFIMIGNILDNAVKYTPETGAISISLSKDGRLEIADTGPGLSDADKERVFERFVRADTTGKTGSGLGLSIAKWVCESHGANISLRDAVPHGLIVSILFLKP
ncbi:MAG: sensor histidine kinase N-terminal domain-containing protein [Rhodospirillales bacterium]|nr:sensor histidine kinase N-terminal domain-containing protein [Rhodospirillales bacterium]MCB9980456.1 sensor histidine kinase N-terminal domain-containing protein [Rhodospirillales bacterium]